MRKDQQTTPAAGATDPADQHLAAAIRRHVLSALGQPIDPHRVEVRRLWEHHYRVNILLPSDPISARVAHSFFLVADGEGNVVESTPAILRSY